MSLLPTAYKILSRILLSIDFILAWIY